LLTDLNALMALAYVHPFAQNADLSAVPPENIHTTANGQNGTTTIYRVPTRQLPLTMPLRQLGVPETVVDGVDSLLRPIIDQGYQDPRPRPPRAGSVGQSQRRPESRITSRSSVPHPGGPRRNRQIPA
jgi:hypothetical protein